MIKSNPGQIPVLNDILKEVLVCPRDHADLEQQGEELVCLECGHRYQIENGVPNMLIVPD